MKFIVNMKTPDCIYCSLPCIYDDKYDEIAELCTKWFEYGEEVSLEVDTEKQTCTVLEVNDY